MAKNAVTSNFEKFNKNQRALIERFQLDVNSSVGDYIRASVTTAKEVGLEKILVPKIAEKNAPIRINGKLLFNPILPRSSYKKVHEQKDLKKFVVRSGEMNEAFSEVGEFTGNKRIGTAKNRSKNSKFVVERIDGNVKGKIIFSGNPARAINRGSGKTQSTGLRGRRRIMESAFTKLRGIWKKQIRNKRLLSR